MSALVLPAETPAPPADPATSPPSGRDLPPPVARWLETAWPDGIPDWDTLVLEGPARFRRGRLPWLPLHARMSHRLGRDHVADLRLRLGPLTLLRVIDGSVGGTGISRVGRSVDAGPHVDQGAFVFLWSEALQFPVSWRHLPGLRWETVDARSADARLPFRGEVVRARVTFDPASGMPASFSARRCKGSTSMVGWRVDFAGWTERPGGFWAPGQATVAWLDEPGPWFWMRIEQVLPNAPVTEIMTTAARAIEAAGGGTERPGPSVSAR